MSTENNDGPGEKGHHKMITRGQTMQPGATKDLDITSSLNTSTIIEEKEEDWTKTYKNRKPPDGPRDTSHSVVPGGQVYLHGEVMNHKKKFIQN